MFKIGWRPEEDRLFSAVLKRLSFLFTVSTDWKAYFFKDTMKNKKSYGAKSFICVECCSVIMCISELCQVKTTLYESEQTQLSRSTMKPFFNSSGHFFSESFSQLPYNNCWFTVLEPIPPKLRPWQWKHIGAALAVTKQQFFQCKDCHWISESYCGRDLHQVPVPCQRKFPSTIIFALVSES